MTNLTDSTTILNSVEGGSIPTPFVGQLRTEVKNQYGNEKGGSIRHRDGSRTIVSTVRLSHPNLVFSRAIRETPSVEVKPNYQAVDGGTRLLICTVTTETLGIFEDALEHDHTVSDVMVIDYEVGSPVYRTCLTDAAFPLMPILGQLGVSIRRIVGTGVGWTLQAQFPSRGAFATFRRFCAKKNVDFQIDTLSWGDDEVPGGSVDLTTSQWRTLDTAYERGYFEVPRRISQAELASELGISASAVSHRIRRGMSKLIEEQIRSEEN